MSNHAALAIQAASPIIVRRDKDVRVTLHLCRMSIREMHEKREKAINHKHFFPFLKKKIVQLYMYTHCV